MKSKSKIGYITRSLLVKKGKRDAKNKIIIPTSKDDTQLTSPYFNEEISICLSKIHREYEMYLKQKEKMLDEKEVIENRKRNFLLEINSLNDEKAANEKRLLDLKQTKIDFNDYSYFSEPIRNDEKELMPNYDLIIREYQNIENQAHYEMEKNNLKKQIDSISNAIMEQPKKIKTCEEQIKLLDMQISKIDDRMEIQFQEMTEKCKQHYALTNARLSAYWSGVLRKLDYNEIISSQLSLTSIFAELRKEISNIEEFRKEWNQ